MKIGILPISFGWYFTNSAGVRFRACAGVARGVAGPGVSGVAGLRIGAVPTGLASGDALLNGDCTPWVSAAGGGVATERGVGVGVALSPPQATITGTSNIRMSVSGIILAELLVVTLLTKPPPDELLLGVTHHLF